MKKLALLTVFFISSLALSAQDQSNAPSGEAALNQISNVSGSSEHVSRWQEGLVYKVQIMTSRTPLANEDPRLRNLGNVYQYQHNGLTKYTWGRTRLAHEAARLQREMHRNGFKDAFVVYFYNGKRVTSEEAAKIRQQ